MKDLAGRVCAYGEGVQCVIELAIGQVLSGYDVFCGGRALFQSLSSSSLLFPGARLPLFMQTAVKARMGGFCSLRL